MNSTLPLVSVIVTTKNEEKNIERCLKSVKIQTYKNINLIVVDNNSKDRTTSLAAKYTSQVFIYGPERSAQRNFGAKKAKGNYFLFIDADMELSAKVVGECVSKINVNSKIGGIIIPEVSIGTRFWEKTKAFERSFYNKSGDESTDAARFFPKEVYEAIGGYDENITGPEDWDLPDMIKAKGYKIDRINEKIFHYENIPSLRSLLRKKYYYGIQSHRYLDKHQVSTISSKTLYFLRPVFYREWKEFFKHPLLGLGLIAMLTGELFAGGTGYLIGKVNKS
ncbi:MAG TPA: glycosyltransferase [Patescibacteria group bacterium]|nr:glycosyltransferase [Patescibacteria group bacterium]